MAQRPTSPSAHEGEAHRHRTAAPVHSKLNLRQTKFVAAYLKTGNATQSAISAGYSPQAAAGQGMRLLRNAQIRAAVAKSGSKATEKAEITAEWVLARLRAMATKTKARDSDRIKALELLGKNLVLFTEKVEHSGSVALTVTTDVPQADDE